MKKIVIIGAKGFLGTKLTKILSNYFEVIPADINSDENSLDVTNLEKVKEFMEKHQPEVVISTVALTSSFACEKNSELAKKLNYGSIKNIIEATKNFNPKIVFVSSSYLFDGNNGNYSEEDPLLGKEVYSKEKKLAEKILFPLKNSVIFRVDLLYGYNGRGFPNGHIGKILSKEEFYLGNPDQLRSPLWIDDFANIIKELINKDVSGVYHLAGPDKLSMKEFIGKLGEINNTKPKIKILEEKELLVKPKKDTTLNASKVRQFKVNFHSISEAIELIKKQLQ